MLCVFMRLARQGSVPLLGRGPAGFMHQLLVLCSHSCMPVWCIHSALQEKKKKWEPPAPPPRVGKKQRKRDAQSGLGSKLPTVTPSTKCKLRLLKLERIKDYLLMEHEFVQNQEQLKPQDERNEEDRSKVCSHGMHEVACLTSSTAMVAASQAAASCMPLLSMFYPTPWTACKLAARHRPVACKACITSKVTRAAGTSERSCCVYIEGVHGFWLCNGRGYIVACMQGTLSLKHECVLCHRLMTCVARHSAWAHWRRSLMRSKHLHLRCLAASHRLCWPKAVPAWLSCSCTWLAGHAASFSGCHVAGIHTFSVMRILFLAPSLCLCGVLLRLTPTALILLFACSHAIVSSAVGPEYYVGITSFVDKTQLEPGCSVLLHNKVRLDTHGTAAAGCN